jgi:hypothetical protein
MRQAVGGGPEAQQRVVDDVRTVRRAQHIRQQMGTGWAGNPVDLDRAALEEAARQIAAPMNSAAQYQQEQYARIATPAVGVGSESPEEWHRRSGQVLTQILEAQDKRFSRFEVIVSLRAIMASKGGIAEAITAFENLE